MFKGVGVGRTKEAMSGNQTEAPVGTPLIAYCSEMRDDNALFVFTAKQSIHSKYMVYTMFKCTNLEEAWQPTQEVGAAELKTEVIGME